MTYQQVKKSVGHSLLQKKQSQMAPSAIDDHDVQTNSQPPLATTFSIPSRAERDAIRKSLFGIQGEQIQTKLTIGAPGDKYEQEADRVAAQVVHQINAPMSSQPEQSQSLQREAIPSEEQLQMKAITQVQRSEAGMAATPDLETSIQQARGSGQPLADNIRQPMERAFGADFSGVKVHTNAQSHQLNQSIQAKAFTTGQDVFFRQGEYNPASRGGQELIAHELTHVVQQNGGEVQRSPVFAQRQREVILQHREVIAGGEASTDLESALASAPESGHRQAGLQAQKGQGKADNNYSAQQQQPIQKKESLTRPSTSVTTRMSHGQVVQRSVKIKGIGGKKYANFDALSKNRNLFKPLMDRLVSSYSEEAIKFHLKQFFSLKKDKDIEFENQEHFEKALIYDIENKSMKGEKHTLQEQYMTEYGWTERQRVAGSQPPTAGGGGESSSEPGRLPPTAAGGVSREPERLKVYRTMNTDEWEALEGGKNPKALGRHLGDFKQAQNYFYRKSPEPKVLVEFTLKLGEERKLFSPEVMAFPDLKGNNVPNMIKSTLGKEGVSGSFGKATTNEGLAPNMVGVKAEGGEAGFSLGIGGGQSPNVFMKLVESMVVIADTRSPSED